MTGRVQDHAIDGEFGRWYTVIAYKAIPVERELPSKGLTLLQTKVATVYRSFDKPVEGYIVQQEEGVGVGSLGATWYANLDESDMVAISKKLYTPPWFSDHYGDTGIKLLSHYGRSDDRDGRTVVYHLYSQQMLDSFAHALGASGMASHYAGYKNDPSIDTRSMPIQHKDHFDEEPTYWIPMHKK